MSKEFDKQVLNTTVMSVVQDTFYKMLHAEMQGEPVFVEKDIIEYDSRMRVFPMEKFNGPCYVAYINFFLSHKVLEEGLVIGSFVLFVKGDVAERLLKAFGRPLKDAEDESILFDNIGEFCNILAGHVKNELTNLGYADLTISPPTISKNSVESGVPFDYALYRKHEISFQFWGQKCIVIEVCMGYVPQKGK